MLHTSVFPMDWTETTLKYINKPSLFVFHQQLGKLIRDDYINISFVL